jgi:hypothetical protein
MGNKKKDGSSSKEDKENDRLFQRLSAVAANSNLDHHHPDRSKMSAAKTDKSVNHSQAIAHEEWLRKKEH